MRPYQTSVLLGTPHPTPDRISRETSYTQNLQYCQYAILPPRYPGRGSRHDCVKQDGVFRIWLPRFHSFSSTRGYDVMLYLTVLLCSVPRMSIGYARFTVLHIFGFAKTKEKPSSPSCVSCLVSWPFFFYWSVRVWNVNADDDRYHCPVPYRHTTSRK